MIKFTTRLVAKKEQSPPCALNLGPICSHVLFGRCGIEVSDSAGYRTPIPCPSASGLNGMLLSYPGKVQ